MDTVHECDRQTDRQTDGQTDGQNYDHKDCRTVKTNRVVPDLTITNPSEVRSGFGENLFWMKLMPSTMLSAAIREVQFNASSVTPLFASLWNHAHTVV